MEFEGLSRERLGLLTYFLLCSFYLFSFLSVSHYFTVWNSQVFIFKKCLPAYTEINIPVRLNEKGHVGLPRSRRVSQSSACQVLVAKIHRELYKGDTMHGCIGLNTRLGWGAEDEGRSSFISMPLGTISLNEIRYNVDIF